MSPRTGRPPMDNPKNIRLEIRLDKDTNEILYRCTESLNISRTDVIVKGIKMVKAKLDNKK